MTNSSIKSENIIYVDYRERELILTLKKMKYNYIIKKLVVGDVIVGNYIIELKKGNDLITSLYDSRIFFQSNKMCNTTMKKILIIYDLENIYKNVSNRNTINGLLTTLMLMNINVIPVGTVKDVSYVLIRLSSNKQINRNIENINNYSLPKFKNIKQRKIAGLSCIESVSLKKSKILLNKFGTIMDIGFNIDKISELHGFGSKIVKNIRDFLF